MNARSEPLVSIILPTYNEEQHFVKKAINSIKKQTYENIECIVVDGGHGEWLEHFCRSCEFCKYVFKENEGASAARNVGLEICKGTYIGFLDADDYFDRTKIRNQVDCLQQGADIVYSDVVDILPSGTKKYRKSFVFQEEREHVEFFRYDCKRGNIHTSSLLFRSTVLGQKRFDRRILSGQDFHLWTRLFNDSKQIRRISQPLVYVNQRNASLSSDPDLVYENRVKAIEDLCNRYPELEEYKKERINHEEYTYGRDLLFDSRPTESRSVLLNSINDKNRTRVIVLMLVSLIPVGQKMILEILNRLQSIRDDKYNTD